jgi:hypothetical protein
MIISPNYTFSIPHTRLYTLYKGLTVTPCPNTGLQRVFVRSCHLYNAAPLVSASYDALLHVWRSHVSWRPLRPSQGHCSRRTFGAEVVHDPTPPVLGLRGIPPGRAGTCPLCGASNPFTPSALKVHIL